MIASNGSQYAVADGIDEGLVLALAEETVRLGRRLDPAERSLTRILMKERGLDYGTARFMIRRVRVELERLWRLIDGVDLPA